jgi:hypothetical protein
MQISQDTILGRPLSASVSYVRHDCPCWSCYLMSFLELVVTLLYPGVHF